MADQYEVATGFNNSGSLAKIDPQPASPGIGFGQRDHAISMNAYDRSESGSLEFVGAITLTEYTSILSQLGLTNAVSADLTLRLLTHDRQWVNKNVTIIRPRPGEDLSFARGRGWYDKAIFFFHVLGDAT